MAASGRQVAASITITFLQMYKQDLRAFFIYTCVRTISRLVSATSSKVAILIITEHFDKYAAVPKKCVHVFFALFLP